MPPTSTLKIAEPKLNALYSYWLSKCGNRPMPARPDIDPVEIPDLLPSLLLMDTAEELANFRFRLFGTELCKQFGEDRTGMNIGDFRVRIDNQEQVFAGDWNVYAERRPDYFPDRTLSVEKDFIRYSRVLLPLSPDGATVNMILGGIEFHRQRLE